MDKLESLVDGQTGVEEFFVGPLSAVVAFDPREGFHVLL